MKRFAEGHNAVPKPELVPTSFRLRLPYFKISKFDQILSNKNEQKSTFFFFGYYFK